MPVGATIADIPQPVLHDCCQLVKENSITGSKQASVKVVYTPWANLRKDQQRMDTGTIGFHDEKAVIRVKVAEKDKEAIKRLNKTKREEEPDLEAQRQERDEKERAAKKRFNREQATAQKQVDKKHRQEAHEKSYDRIFECADMMSNVDLEASEDTSAAVDFEDDFM